MQARDASTKAVGTICYVHVKRDAEYGIIYVEFEEVITGVIICKLKNLEALKVF